MTTEQDDIGFMSDSNTIYIYGDITRKLAMLVIKEIKKMDGELHKSDPITIRMSSYGGATYGAFTIAQTLMRLERKTVGIADIACSAGFMIWLGTKERKVSTYATILMHQHQSWSYGKYQDLLDERKFQDLCLAI